METLKKLVGEKMNSPLHRRIGRAVGDIWRSGAKGKVGLLAVPVMAGTGLTVGLVRNRNKDKQG